MDGVREMAAITIDDATRFVSVLSFKLQAGDLHATSREVQKTVKERVPKIPGCIGSVVMVNEGQSQLLVVSLWDSAHAWSAAQYDREIGQVVSDAVQIAMSYEIQTYESVAVVRAR